MRLCVPTGQEFVTGGLTDYGWLEWADSSVDIQTHKVDNAMEANPAKFQGLLLKGNKQASDFRVIIQGQQIEFSKSITTLGICIDENLTFDEHVNERAIGDCVLAKIC